MLAMMRVLGLFMLAPVFSHNSVPAVSRLVLAAALGAVAMPVVELQGAFPKDALTLIFWLTKELAVGLLIGMAMRMLFFVLDFAAQVLTMQIGLMPSPEFDPAAASAGNPLGSILYFFGLMMLLSGSEYDMLYAFARSYEVAPVGFTGVNAFAGDFIIRSTAGVFKVGVLMGAPILAVNFLVNLVFATLGKVVPKLNVFILSFSARILFGTSVLVVTIGLIAHYAADYLRDTPEMMLRFIIFRPEL